MEWKWVSEVQTKKAASFFRRSSQQAMTTEQLENTVKKSQAVV